MNSWVRASLVVVLCGAIPAFAESGSTLNLHLEPGVAFPQNDPGETPLGQGISLKADIPVVFRLALQLQGTALSFQPGRYFSPGTVLGGGVGVRFRLLDDNEGYLLHVGEDPASHRGNILGNLWVDASALFLGGGPQVRTGLDVGLGAEVSLVDGLQLGPFVKLNHFGPETLIVAGLSISVGIPEPAVHDTDPDGDGIPTSNDKCPNDAEDKDGFEDEDGCPDLDNDKDGIADAADKCPLEPEDKDGFEDGDGCIDPDNDGDGVPDTADKCPLQAEDMDGFEDEDGCPDLDNDRDGLPDATDQCPNQAEDKDGFEDEDGCPDLDNDRDGVPDAMDKCPDKPETRNGIDDEDGCPEEAAKVYVEDKQVVITEKIFFQTNKAKILPKSFGLLDSVAQVLSSFPQIKKLRVEGHTDDVGNDASNQKLSEARAKAVVDYLVKKGVAQDRLEFVGHGKTKPLAEGKDAASREQNRRVEFTIVDPADGVIPVVIDPSAPNTEATEDAVPAPAPEGSQTTP